MKKTLVAILLSIILLATPMSALAFWCPPPPGPGPEPDCAYLAVSINGVSAIPPAIAKNFTELQEGKCTYFTVEVSIYNVVDLFGYEFTLDWPAGYPYFELMEWHYAEAADDMFGAGHWFKIDPAANYTGTPPYKQSIAAIDCEGFDGDHLLVQLLFHIKEDVCWLEQGGYVEGSFCITAYKFVDSCSEEIPFCDPLPVVCAYWRFYAVQPKIWITPAHEINCRVWNGINCTDPDHFVLTINVANITKMASLHFGLYWPMWYLNEFGEDTYTPIINFTKATVNTAVFPAAKFNWTVTASVMPPDYQRLDFHLWNITNLIPCNLVRGNFWAVQFEFEKQDPFIDNGQPNYSKLATCWEPDNVTIPIDFLWGYFDVYCNDYAEIEFGHVIPETWPFAIDVGGMYTLDPIPGDLDGDGDVDLTDLMIEAMFYGAPIGGPNLPNDYYNLNNDGAIDIADIVIVAKNFCHPPCP